MDPEKIMDGLSKELNSALKAMAKRKNVNDKEVIVMLNLEDA
jgi:hypothetical protein